MCKFTGKSNEQILCKLSKSEILRLYSIVHVAMETTKTSNFICQSRSFVSIVFTCQVSTHELQPFSYHHFANDIYSQTAKTVFSHLKDSPLDSWTHEILWCYHWKKPIWDCFFWKDFTKRFGNFFSKIDSDCYFIERIKHPLFKFTSQSCLVTFFRLSNSNSYLSSRYIYTCNSHSMNVYLRNWYIILVTYLVPEHNVKNFHCKFKVMSHMVRKMFLTWY